ncbi:hypothetical protein [Aquimarina macrocephali]|uniref:hypothetical protein n=1 Tax=Aquimarina macrocephali TaxID=666563 RepID=UPI0004657E4C|nr:hypothetical protein [Aquimarina macrocephali]
MKIQEDEPHYQFTLNVLKALHLDAGSFFDDVANDAPYEVQIYKWIDKLYKQGKSIDEAIELIHRVRRFFIL